MEYYVYIFSKNGVPYYVGKGCGNRYRCRCATDVPTPSADNTQVLLMPNEQSALDTEVQLIKFFGRTIDGGTLMNKVLGGRGVAGCTWNDGENNPYFAKEGAEHPTSKCYVITHPDGTEELVRGLSSWCRKHNLYRGGFVKMLNGSRTTPVQGYKVRHATV